MTTPSILSPKICQVGLVCSLAMLLGGTASAAEYGTVVSSTPVTAQVGVPQTQCTDEEQTVQARPTGLGAVAGALIGGAIGHGAGRGGAATGAGVLAGAVIGGAMEANALPTQTATVQHCQNVTRYETRVIGYDVAYDYAGVRYQSRFAQDPGPRVALNVSVVPVGSPTPAFLAAPQSMVYARPVTVVDPVVVVGPPPRWGHRPRLGPY